MSRRCLICSNLNPCNQHSGVEQDAELRRNTREGEAILAERKNTPAPGHADAGKGVVVHGLQLVTTECAADPEHAWALFCNIAVPIMDAANVSHQVANEAAAHLMQHLFEYDITTDERYAYEKSGAQSYAEFRIAMDRDEDEALAARPLAPEPTTGEDWFTRNADYRNPKAAIRTNPEYFASECAAAISNGTLAHTPAPDTRLPEGMEGYAPCPTCHQYSHSLGGDHLAEAFNHFQSMFSHRGDGIPTQYTFDEKTRDAAQVLMTAARSTPHPAVEVTEKRARECLAKQYDYSLPARAMHIRAGTSDKKAIAAMLAFAASASTTEDGV